MSKYVKNLLTSHLQERFQSVTEAVLVSVEGLDAKRNGALRSQLRSKNMELLVVKNSLARRATQGTELAAAFEGMNGPVAVVWGGEDIIDVAKEVARITASKEFEPLAVRGGVMEGTQLTAEDVQRVSKWPNRQEQLSLLAGQILSVGGMLASQLGSVGGGLVSQIKQRAESADEADGQVEQ